MSSNEGSHDCWNFALWWCPHPDPKKTIFPLLILWTKSDTSARTHLACPYAVPRGFFSTSAKLRCLSDSGVTRQFRDIRTCILVYLYIRDSIWCHKALRHRHCLFFHSLSLTRYGCFDSISFFYLAPRHSPISPNGGSRCCCWCRNATERKYFHLRRGACTIILFCLSFLRTLGLWISSSFAITIGSPFAAFASTN